MKKICFIATVDIHINSFHLKTLKEYHDKGFEVHVVTGESGQIKYCDKKHVIDVSRNPFKLNNIKAIKQLKKIFELEQFDLIWCHTPMGGVVTRLAAKNVRKQGITKVYYTAHGFHFFKGAPIINWLLYYPMEKYLSKYTDILYTINQEDYNLSLKKFKKTKVEYLKGGVEINKDKFNIQLSLKEKKDLRKSLGIDENDIVMIFPAELNKNKNQIFLINCMKELVKINPNIHLLLPGKDNYNGKYQYISKTFKLDNNIHFLGFRNDIPQLLKISDIAVSSSKREGLPVNIKEALYCNLPVVALNCRGMKDALEDAKNGFIVYNEKEFIDRISTFINL